MLLNTKSVYAIEYLISFPCKSGELYPKPTLNNCLVYAFKTQAEADAWINNGVPPDYKVSPADNITHYTFHAGFRRMIHKEDLPPGADILHHVPGLQ